MVGKLNRLRRWLFLGTVVGAGLFGVLAVMTWPRMFVSEGRELTGMGIELRESARFDRASREGLAGSVYRITDQSAGALDANQVSLKRYPMWSALAFDGYKRVRWQPVDELKSGPNRLLARAVLRSDAGPVDAASVSTVDEAQQLAAWLSHQEGVQISGWYTERDGVVTNYVAYILDVKRRLIVKLSLLT